MMESKQVFRRVGTSLVIGSLFIFIAQMAGNLLLESKPEWMESSMVVLAVSTLPILLVGYPVMTWMLRKLPTTKAEKKQMGKKEFISCIFLTFGTMYFFNYLGMGILFLIKLFIGKEVINPVEQVVLESDYLALFLFMVILAPIAEELFFRKVLIDKTLVCGEKTAIFASAFVFSLIHGNFQQSFYAFFLGLLFAFLYVKTGNIIYPMILHIIINFFGSFLIKYILDQIPAEILEASEEQIMTSMSTPGAGMMILSIFLCIVFSFAIMGIVIYIKNRKKFSLVEEKEQGNILKTTLLNPGMILFIIYYGFNIVVLLLV